MVTSDCWLHLSLRVLIHVQPARVVSRLFITTNYIAHNGITSLFDGQTHIIPFKRTGTPPFIIHSTYREHNYTTIKLCVFTL